MFLELTKDTDEIVLANTAKIVQFLILEGTVHLDYDGDPYNFVALKESWSQIKEKLSHAGLFRST